MRKTNQLEILFIDDDPFNSSYYVLMLQAAGFRVEYVKSVDEAIEAATERSFAAVVVDIMMPFEPSYESLETSGGFRTGVVLAREIEELQPTAAIVALTNSEDPLVQSWFSTSPAFDYFYKGDTSPEDFPNILRNKILGIEETPQIFIVHGHDMESALSLKNYLQHILNLPEPVILAEKPSLGMTLIEKFEYYAHSCDVVFALFTPDDFRNTSGTVGRARQNVVFEYGYFLGFLGRHSSRIFLLYKNEVEMPSDIQGIVCIDISNGIEAAGEEIQRELRGLRHRDSI
ncbi:MAG: nucleotide-binding protein [Acidobacteriota bacterium]|nr:nucleotide-binding protein [Acidobacteriota bacterium]